MINLGIDVVAEMAVFVTSIIALRRIDPQFSAWRILSGLIRTHLVTMTLYAFCAWLTILLFQNTFSGVDVSFRFEWLACEGKENATWLGGFEWEC